MTLLNPCFQTVTFGFVLPDVEFVDAQAARISLMLPNFCPFTKLLPAGGFPMRAQP